MMWLILGTACDPEVIAVTDVSWYTEIKFSDETKAWFQSSKPPQCVIDDLNVVLKNNEKYKALRVLP